MGKFTRNRVDSPEYAKNPDQDFFATYFRRVALTYMEIETSNSKKCSEKLFLGTLESSKLANAEMGRPLRRDLSQNSLAATRSNALETHRPHIKKNPRVEGENREFSLEAAVGWKVV